MEENLESKVKKYEPIGSTKAFLIDTSARILFYVPVIGVWEKYVAGMENEEVLKSRLSAVALNFVIGRVHGKIREFFSYITKTDENSSKLRKVVVDTAAGFIVGVSSYAAVLYASGASLDEALVAIPFAVGLTTVTGRPFGKFLDVYRKFWGTTPVYEKEK